MNVVAASTRALSAVALALCACTSVKVSPELTAREASPPELHLPAHYEGDPRHLPLGVVAVSNADAPFEYDFEVGYERSDLPSMLAVINPLTLVGFPVGSTRVTAVATLTAREAGVVVKRYEATAVVKKMRTLYSSDSQTELRARALAAVRDNIETQIAAEAGYLRALESAAVRSAPGSAEVPE